MPTTTDLSALTREDALAALRAAVEAKGEGYIYVNRDGHAATGPNVTCHYVHYDAHGGLEPGCIVGHVLAGWGVPLEDLLTFEGDSATTICRELGLTTEVGQTLRMAQSEQDVGSTWGYAVEAATSDTVC